jgi:hypothetical protein
MRWAHEVVVRCGWCEAVTKAGRHVSQAGELEAVRWALPAGWTEQAARPGLTVVRLQPVEIDPFEPEAKLAPKLGAPIEAFACAPCTSKLRPLAAQQREPFVAEPPAPRLVGGSWPEGDAAEKPDGAA